MNAPGASAPFSVLHISAAEGGGVDRYVRDIAREVPLRHFLWHTGAGIDMIEDIATQQFLPLSKAVADPAAPIALAEWLCSRSIGIVHLHGVGERCRDRLSLLQSVRATPWVVTLHDVTFVDPRAFALSAFEPDLGWIADVSDTLARAATVIVPSAYIRALALRHFPSAQCEFIAPGVASSQGGDGRGVPTEFTANRPAHVVAIIGAIGPHKGSGLLDELAAELHGTDIGLVVIGYTDSQLTQGWREPRRCYVHGPYIDAELSGLISGYGVDVALFPNRLPESFSYTLSEVWAAGIPVVVPEEGALGERVSQYHGGWLLPARFSAEDAVRLLRRLFAPTGAGERARVKSQIDPRDSARIPPLAAMARDIDALYERFGLKPPSSDNDSSTGDQALQPLLAANLDGFAFRKELIKLADEAVQLKAALEGAAAKFDREVSEVQAWTRKLEHDIELLTAKVKEQLEEIRLLRDDKAAFDQLPLIVRKMLLRRAFRGRR